MQPGGKKSKNSALYITIALVAAVVTGTAIWFAAQQAAMQNVRLAEPQPFMPTKTTEVPNLDTQVVAHSREHIWTIAFLPNKELLFTERKGTLNIQANDTTRELARISDVSARGEGGLMGLAIDPKFTETRSIFVCYNTANDIRVVRWNIAADLSGLEGRKDIITGIPTNPSGRHSGCALAFGQDGYLWVGTGDAAKEATPQDPKSLGGKILRVDRDGKAASGNLPAPYDPRVFSYGHRNTQGIAFFAAPVNDVVGVSAEHGSNVDDEINLLKPGNFGWAPGKNYAENVPMTDTARFPDAAEAIWKSGSPTQAPSGIAVLAGARWKAWEGAIAMAMLKDKHLKLIPIDAAGALGKEEKILTTYGRLRAVTIGPDGNLYLGTSNGGGDQIVKVIPS